MPPAGSNACSGHARTCPLQGSLSCNPSRALHNLWLTKPERVTSLFPLAHAETRKRGRPSGSRTRHRLPRSAAPCLPRRPARRTAACGRLSPPARVPRHARAGGRTRRRCCAARPPRRRRRRRRPGGLRGGLRGRGARARAGARGCRARRLLRCLQRAQRTRAGQARRQAQGPPPSDIAAWCHCGNHVEPRRPAA